MIFPDRFKTLIGIEFTEETIIVTCLKNSLSGVNLFSSSTFPFKEDEETITKINNFISRYAKDTRNIFVSIPLEWSIIKSIDVPLIKGKGEQALSQMMSFEIERHIPYKIDDVFYDYQVIGKTENTNTVLFTIVYKDKIKYIKEFLEKLSIQPRLITLSPYVVLNAIELSSTSVGGWRELLDVTKKPDVFSRKGKICVAIFTAGNHAIFAVLKNGFCFHAKSLMLDFNQPVDMLADNILFEIKLLLQEVYEESMDNLLLTGQITLTPELQNVLSEKLRVSVQVLDPTAKFSKNKIETDLYKLVPSIGACYTGIGAGTLSINLLPHKTDFKIKKFGSLISKITIPLILIFTIGIVAGEIIINKKFLTKIEKKSKENEPEIEIINNLSSNLKILEQKRLFLSHIKEYNIFPEVLLELSTIIPSDTWLTNLNYKEIPDEKKSNFKGELTITGQSKSSSILISILENSSYFENVEFVGPVIKKEGSEGFKIKAVIVKPEETPKESPETKNEKSANPVRKQDFLSNGVKKDNTQQ